MEKRSDFIQIARVISAIAVLSVHLGQALNVTGIFKQLLDLGKYGLYMFFVLSGFLANASVRGGGDMD